MTELDKKLIKYVKEIKEQEDVVYVANRLTTMIAFLTKIKEITLEDSSNLDGFMGIMEPQIQKIYNELDIFKDIIYEYKNKRNLLKNKTL